MALEGAVRSSLPAWTPILPTTAPVTLLNCDLEIIFDILFILFQKKTEFSVFPSV